MDFRSKIQKAKATLEESAQTQMELSKLSSEKIVKASDLIVETYRKGGKVIIFGNGGSAADAQHAASEFVGRFMVDRRSLPAIALTTDSSILTAVSNDYGFENVFSRQVEALADEKDVLIAISTSGTSKNVLDAVKAGKKQKTKIIGLTGKNKSELTQLVDISIDVPSQSTPRIQEAHTTILHIICDLVEQELFEK